MENASLVGRRVLVVEDEALVSMFIEDLLGALGCEVVGPAATIAEALGLVDAAELDGAILDVNLNGAETYPVADALTKRSLPFVFATGYGSEGIRGEYGHVPVLQKPFREGDVERFLSEALSAETLSAKTPRNI